MKILVTGGNSGLGKYITENTPGCLNLTRDNRKTLLLDLKETEVDLIIHCAFGSQGGYDQNDVQDYFKYIDDNILLTKELTEIPHKKIVYISSLIVYNKEYSNYKNIKLYAEAIISKLGTNPLILRCPSMLGKYMKYNNVYKLIKNTNTQLSLTKDSSFNYILHSDILNFILYCFDKNISNDIIDFVSSQNISLEEITNILDIKEPCYGKYNFNTPLMSNKKLLSYNNNLDKTSKEAFIQFLNQL